MLTLVAQRRPIRKILRASLIALGGLALLAAVSLFFPRYWLVADSGPVKGDVLVLLGGGHGERPRRAAELYQAGEARWILCTGQGDCDSNRALLIHAGVPAAAIREETQSTNTSENARFSIPMLRQLGAKRIILVTSWYHSRRARNTFCHYAPDLVFFSRPAYTGAPTSNWQPQAIRGHVRSEYLKIAGYLIRYGVSPF